MILLRRYVNVGGGIWGVKVQEGTWASGQRGWVELDRGLHRC